MLIVYRKSDKKIVHNTVKSFVEPQGMSDENGKLAVIERIGGTFDDYGTFRLHDIQDKTKVDEILRYNKYVSLIFEGEKAVGYQIDYEKYNQDEMLRQEKELIESLIPSKEEILMAEVELNTINLLQEIGVI